MIPKQVVCLIVNIFQKHYKLIAIVLSKLSELENPDLKQKNNFIARLDENNAAMLFIIEKSEEITFDFLLIL